ncbi:dynamin family protein [Bacillus sp. PS06]|nr:dynamin family protein [Bacillus sp. PS06]
MGRVELSKEELLHRLTAVYDEMKNDKDHAKKVIQLMKKLNQSEFMIGFCGHFSAGKSSMINELIGEELLPSSPIPTSANLVMVKKGREYARVYYKNNDIIEYPAPYNYDVIKQYCKNGEEIDSLEISHNTDKLQKGTTIMDTPGIDSTDDAHRVATESALHLADVIFYVMDYNHVQSELNFQFTKEMTDRNKSIYLIINQIDKHQESELSFEQFKDSVEEAFNDYQVRPEGIYYTSLRDREHPYNQLNELKALISDKILHKEELLNQSTLESTKQLIDEYITGFEHSQSEEKEKLELMLSALTEEQRVNMDDQVNLIKSELELEQDSLEQAKTFFYDGLNKVLDNAILMPFSTRELAKNYLESRQNEFKVGLIFSKAKTEKERENRLNQFYEDLQDKVTSQIQWHLKEYVSRFLKENQLSNLLGLVQEFDLPLKKETLINSYKSGARLTGEYVLTYTDDVANEIKKQYRKVALHGLEQIMIELEKTTNKKITKLKAELTSLKNVQEAISKLEMMHYEYEQRQKKLLDLLIEGDTHHRREEIDQLLQETSNIIISSTDELITTNNKQNEEKEIEKPVHLELKKTDDKQRVQKTIQDLLNVKSEIETIKGLTTLANDMAEKAERLEHNQFTVALFGAFSAGKSSFANALIGSNILPVSPNPTTATINKIKPPTEAYPHGTVIVKLKSQQHLLEDLIHSLQVFGIEAKNVESAIQSITLFLINDVELSGKEKPHFRFLKAVSSGFEASRSHLGNHLHVDIDAFKEYVAIEEKACFVEWIELYYECELTSKGITLVDTPGADSINARHTGVAFNYIKNADAILFVTYYNHAFSKADREFLIQLGRVKDSFSMDKMFFIINAADLASSIAELEDVKEYVGTQLISYGIRKPRLYALSSQMALKEKTSQEKLAQSVLESSNIHSFEVDFDAFIVTELIEMTIQSAYEDIQRAKSTINYYIESAQESKEAKRHKLEQVKRQEEQLLEMLDSLKLTAQKDALIQEISELTYYVKQRIFLRYSDFFKEAFNPVSLRDDGRDLKKTLWVCLDELIDSIGFDLAQEMRATSLRIEGFIQQTVKTILLSYTHDINEIDEHISLSKSIQHDFPEIDFENALQDIEQQQFKKAIALFKNPKSFFEKNEKKMMSQEIEHLLQEPVSNYLKEQQTRLDEWYVNEFNVSIAEMKKKISSEITDYYEGFKQALSEEVDIEKLLSIQQSMTKLT